MTNRVRHSQNRWLTVRTGLQDSVQKPLSNSITDYPVKVTHVKKSSKSVIEMRVLETNQEFKFLEECVETINTRLIALVSLDGLDLGVLCMIDSFSLSLFHPWLIVIVRQ